MQLVIKKQYQEKPGPFAQFPQEQCCKTRAEYHNQDVDNDTVKIQSTSIVKAHFRCREIMITGSNLMLQYVPRLWKTIKGT